MTNPRTSTKGMRMIWDMDIFQKYNRKVTTCVFWNKKMRNRIAKTRLPMNLGFFTRPPLSRARPLSASLNPGGTTLETFLYIFF